MPPSAAIIIPCFNERDRFPSTQRALRQACPDALLVAVDDGSDEPLRPEDAPGVVLLSYAENRGKGYAVRHGWSWVADHHPETDILAFADADGAVPAAEVARLLHLMQSTPCDLLTGARVAMLGRDITRSALRHYLGRIFATLSSCLINLPAYDTQCGCKFIRRSTYLGVCKQLLIDGFAFDVELIARVRRSGGTIREEPVDWHDQAGSKLGLIRDGMCMLVDLFRLRESLDQARG